MRCCRGSERGETFDSKNQSESRDMQSLFLKSCTHLINNATVFKFFSTYKHLKPSSIEGALIRFQRFSR